MLIEFGFSFLDFFEGGGFRGLWLTHFEDFAKVNGHLMRIEGDAEAHGGQAPRVF